MIRHICILITIALTVSSQTADNDTPSPCPDVFRYEKTIFFLPRNDQPLKKRWYGVIKLSTDETLHAVWLNVVFNHKVDMLVNWFGNVTTKDNLNFNIVNDEIKIFPGEPKTVRFLIDYIGENKPEVQSILFNGRQICYDPKSVVNETISKPDNHQQVVNKSPSTENYTQVNLGSTKVDNNLLVNKSQIINPGKINQQLRPDNQLNILETTTGKTSPTVSYPSTSEIYNATVSPNIQIKPDDKFQDYRPSITENYNQSNVGNNEQNSGLRNNNFQQAYLPVKQYIVPDSTQKKTITVNIEVSTNNQQRKPVETVPIQGTNTEQNFNDESQGVAVSQQVKPVPKPTSNIQWSNVPSELSYGSTDSQLDQEDDEKYPFVGLPKHIPNFKPEVRKPSIDITISLTNF